MVLFVLGYSHAPEVLDLYLFWVEDVWYFFHGFWFLLVLNGLLVLVLSCRVLNGSLSVLALGFRRSRYSRCLIWFSTCCF